MMALRYRKFGAKGDQRDAGVDVLIDCAIALVRSCSHVEMLRAAYGKELRIPNLMPTVRRAYNALCILCERVSKFPVQRCLSYSFPSRIAHRAPIHNVFLNLLNILKLNGENT